MFELPDLTELKEFVSLLAPGLIILVIRSAVREGGPRPALQDRLFSYAAVSAAYYSAAHPIFNWNGGVLIDPSLWFLLQYFAVPTLIGVLAAYEFQGEWIRKIAQSAGLYLPHPIPTAWDFAFDRIEKGTFVIVTLSNGTKVPGLVGANSLASSSREERDLLLEEVWIIETDGTWSQAAPKRSILLCGRDIRHIEIFGP